MQQRLKLWLVRGGHEQLDAGSRTQARGWLEPPVDQLGDGAKQRFAARARCWLQCCSDVAGIEHVEALDRKPQDVDAAPAVVRGRAASEPSEIVDPVVREGANSRLTDEL